MPERKTIKIRRIYSTLLFPRVNLRKKIDSKSTIRVTTEHISKVIILSIQTEENPYKKIALRARNNRNA